MNGTLVPRASDLDVGRNNDLRDMGKKKKWAELHQDELRADWDLASNGEPIYKIDPLT